MSEKEKKYKNADETLEIIKEILDYNKNIQKNFQLPSKADKGKSEPKLEKSTSEKTKLRRERIAEIKREEENINNLTFYYYFINTKIQVICIKNYVRQKAKEMKIKYI